MAVGHILPETISFGLHFCCRHYGSNFDQFDGIGPEAAEFDEKRKITAITLFKVIQDHRFWYQRKATCESIMLTYILSCTVSMLLLIIGQIFAVDSGEEGA